MFFLSEELILLACIDYFLVHAQKDGGIDTFVEAMKKEDLLLQVQGHDRGLPGSPDRAELHQNNPHPD